MNGFSTYYKVRLTQRLTCIINRNIWYDDIYGNFAVDVDYLYDGDTPCIPLVDFKAIFRSHENVFDDDSECYICWTFGLYKESFTHDHFDPNHMEYYPNTNSYVIKRNGKLSRRMEFSIYEDCYGIMNRFDDEPASYGQKKTGDLT